MDNHRCLLPVATLIAFFLWGCAAQAPPPAREVTAGGAVAVWNLENLGAPDPAAAFEPDIEPFLTAAVLDAARESENYAPVEREKLERILSEQQLGSSDLVDEGTRLRLGKIIGARFMVFGTYQIFAGQMRVDLRLVDVESGKIMKTAERTVAAGDIGGRIQAVKAAAMEVFAR